MSSKTEAIRCLGKEPSTVRDEDVTLKGPAMLIRGQMDGIRGGAFTGCLEAIPAACATSLLIGGLLLIGP